MMQRDNLDLLRALEADEAAARRRALWTSSALVLAAAAILAVLLFTAYRQLADVRAQTAAERDSLRVVQQQRVRLAAEVADLEERLAAEYQPALAVDTPTVSPDPQSLRPPPVTDSEVVVADTGRAEAALPARVYLQIVVPDDRTYARSVGQRLGAAGFRVLGVEYVRNAPRLRTTELRYYKRADQPDAQRLLSTLREAGEPQARLVYLGLENNTRVRPHHYEIWFAAGSGEPRPSGAAEP